MSVACATIIAGKQVTWASAHRAVFAGKAKGAFACEAIDAIDTSASITAGVTDTVVNVGLAVRTSEAWLTAAHDVCTKVQTLSTCREEDSFQLLAHNETHGRGRREKQ